MFIVFIRTTILYILVILAMRLMGKRQIGELQPYEFVITIMISDLASIPMQDSRLPLILGIIPIITLMLLKVLISQLQLKCQFARRLIEGEPSILIYNGKIKYKSLKSQQINLDELLEELRLLEYFDLDQIKYAILETNGHISILPNDFNSPSGNGGGTSSGISQNQSQNQKQGQNQNQSQNESQNQNKGKKQNQSSGQSQNQSNNNSQGSDTSLLPKVLVSDGKINKNPLTKFSDDKDCIIKELKKHGIHDIKKVLIALYDTKGNFKYQLFDKYEKEKKK